MAHAPALWAIRMVSAKNRGIKVKAQALVIRNSSVAPLRSLRVHQAGQARSAAGSAERGHLLH